MKMTLTDYCRAVAERAANNMRMSDMYSWSRNYADNLARRARAHEQAEKAMQSAMLIITPSQREISHYLKKGARLAHPDDNEADLAILTTAAILRRAGLGAHVHV